MSEAELPASSRYKAITATATSAAEKMREHEREKSTRLAKEVAEADERIAEAEQERDELVREVHRRWMLAMEALWDERWMRVTTLPQADRRVAPGRAGEVLSEVQAAYLALRKALEKSRWSPSLRRGKRKD